MKIVALDAGHGKHTPGKRTPDDEREWTFNHVVVLEIIEQLAKYNHVKVIRLDDPTGETDVPLQERTDRANAAKADILISYHHNANTGKWGEWTGTETYHYPGSTKGKDLAKAIHPDVVKAYGLRDRGIKSANFHMLRESQMPAILIEGGFMDSVMDIKKMRDHNILRWAGKNIAEALAKYLKIQKKEIDNQELENLYKVQIGAFQQKKNADQLAKQAKEAGFSVYISKTLPTNS